MPTARRATIYFDSKVHRAIRLRAAANDQTVSDVVNDAMKESLAEEADDLAVAKKRRSEPSILFSDAVRSLRRRGKI